MNVFDDGSAIFCVSNFFFSFGAFNWCKAWQKSNNSYLYIGCVGVCVCVCVFVHHETGSRYVTCDY